MRLLLPSVYTLGYALPPLAGLRSDVPRFDAADGCRDMSSLGFWVSQRFGFVPWCLWRSNPLRFNTASRSPGREALL
jgi:hypothetical protein